MQITVDILCNKQFSSHHGRQSYQLIITRCNIFAMLLFWGMSNIISPNQFNHFRASWTAQSLQRHFCKPAALKTLMTASSVCTRMSETSQTLPLALIGCVDLGAVDSCKSNYSYWVEPQTVEFYTCVFFYCQIIMNVLANRTKKSSENKTKHNKTKKRSVALRSVKVIVNHDALPYRPLLTSHH